LVLLPVLFLVYASLLSDAPGARGAALTLDNWTALAAPEHLLAIFNTLQLAFYVTVISVVVGTILAWLVSRTDLPWAPRLSMLFVLPILLAPLLTALAWTVLASPRAGFINVIFHYFVPVSWPLFDVYSLGGMVLVMTLYFIPFAYLVLLGALQGIDGSFEDASRIAGAGVLRTLREVTLPVVWPSLASSALLIFALAAEQLAVPTLLGLAARVPTLQYDIYIAMIQSPVNPNYAATAGTLLMLISLAGVALYRRSIGLSRRFVTISGKAAPPKRVKLGPLRYVALAFALLYLLAAVVAPYGALVLGSFLKFVSPELTPDLFTLANYTKLFQDETMLASARNSLVFSLTAATVTLGFSAVLSYLIARHGGWVSQSLELVATLPLAIPAISLGLGLLWTYVYIPVGIYGTGWILGVAYLTRFNPQSMRTLSASIVQIDPDLEFATRIHGASAVRAAWDVTRPLLAPALMAAWVLIFVQMMLEISMTIMLYTPRTATVAISIWFAYFGGQSVLAYTLAVILATFSFLVIALGQRFFGLLRHVP
jgi:iron(III) transport system permease protein